MAKAREGRTGSSSTRGKEPRPEFVSYARHAKDTWELARAAATGETVRWTVHPAAVRGDVVLFYCMRPLGAFIAHGRVLRRLEERFGRRGKPTAEVAMLRLLPQPVTIVDAKRKLAFPWLKAAQGFERHPCEGVSLLIALGSDR